MIFLRKTSDDVESETLFSSQPEEEFDRGLSPLVRVVAAILVVSLFILMTDLFFSLVLGR